MDLHTFFDWSHGLLFFRVCP